MKKTILIIVMAFLITPLVSSCTMDEIIPEVLLEEVEACCGEGENPPPPPPPPPGSGS